MTGGKFKLREKWNIDDEYDEEALFVKWLVRCAGDGIYEGKTFVEMAKSLGIEPVEEGLGFLSRFREAALPKLVDWFRVHQQTGALTEAEEAA